ncbi:zinc finger, CCHC-type containing protein [Tanacetum coccineum]
MTDSRPVLEQYNKLLSILGRFTQYKMNMDEAIQLGSQLRIKESLRVQDSDKPKRNNVVGPSVVNMVEHNNSSRLNDNKSKCKHHDNTRTDLNKKAKPTCTKGSVDGSSNSLKGQNMFNKSLQNVESSKELWDSLEAKYMAEDASSKKFLVSNFTNYKMTDSRPVLEQYNKLLSILGSHLRIKESLRVQDSDKPKGNNVVGPSVVNMVEHNNSSRLNDNKSKCKHHDNTRTDLNKKAKPTCTKGSVDGSSNSLKGQNMFNKSLQVYYVTYVSEAYFVQDNDVAWWVDSGATIHVCKDRCWFKTYESLNDGSILHMRNESTALVHGRGCVDLRLGHVHFKRMQDMSKGGVIPAFDRDTKNYLCDMHATPSLGNKKYFVTFIDDTSRFCYVYLLHNKDEVLDKFKVFKTEVELQQGSLIKRFRTDREEFQAFRFYAIEPNDSVSINSIIGSRDAIFDENRFSLVPRPSLRILNGTEDIGGSVVPEEVTKEKETINDDMDSIMGNNTWVLADLPPGCKPLGCKWIFKRKLKLDGTIEKFKARLIDVKTAFLNGELDEDVYMNQPQGFIMPGNENKVDLTKEFLSSRFSMKDIGEADVILGIRIKHESNGIAISQSYYIKKVLKKFNYFDCTLVSTPIDTSEKLMPNNGQAVSQLECSRVIGCLMYAMTYTRPDIAFTVGKLSRYNSNPSTQHWQAIQRASKKQTCITGSTMESEFVALAAVGREAEWLKNLLLEIPLWVKPIAPISIHCDSAATLAKAYI